MSWYDFFFSGTIFMSSFYLIWNAIWQSGNSCLSPFSMYFFFLSTNVIFLYEISIPLNLPFCFSFYYTIQTCVEFIETLKMSGLLSFLFINVIEVHRNAGNGWLTVPFLYNNVNEVDKWKWQCYLLTYYASFIFCSFLILIRKTFCFSVQPVVNVFFFFFFFSFYFPLQIHNKILTLIAILCEIGALIWWVCL